MHTKHDVHYRAWWWHNITAKLDRLGNRISSDDRPRIEAALAKYVKPGVTAKEVKAFDLKHQKRIRAEHGECRWCYINWPPGQAGVPPRPQFDDENPEERWANTIAAVTAAARR